MMFRNTSSPTNDNSPNNSSRGNGSVRRSTSRGFDQMTPLMPGYIPGDDDVLVGRGKKCLVHTGNQRFKQIVATQLSAYLAAECRVDKTQILMEVIAEVRANSPNGGFIKLNTKTGQYFEVGDFLAKEKTAQAFRDALHEYYSSSNPSKKKRRVQTDKGSSNGSSGSCNGEGQEESHHSSSERSSLVNAMHSQYTHLQAKSVPNSPTRDYDMEPQTARSMTPPPILARFVTSETKHEEAYHREDQPQYDADATSRARARRHSSVVLGNTLAMLTASLTEADFDSLDHPDECMSGDPFEPIPLSKCNDMDMDMTIPDSLDYPANLE